jgi:hypothetical protein
MAGGRRRAVDRPGDSDSPGTVPVSDKAAAAAALVPLPAAPPADEELGVDDILTFDPTTVVQESRETAVAVVDSPAPPAPPASPVSQAPPIVPDVVIPESLVDTVCPSCGTSGAVDFGRRDSTAFCARCDFPLFWSRDRVVLAANGAADDRGLRRLPGTAGRTALASMLCPFCHEPNPATGVTCLRCGADLYPAAPEPVAVLPEPVVEPVVEPEPRNRWWLPYLVAGVTALIALAVVLVVLYT